MDAVKSKVQALVSGICTMSNEGIYDAEQGPFPYNTLPTYLKLILYKQ